MNIFYKEEERYLGGQFARRPLIPEGEVWLFQRADGEHVIVYGSDNPDDALPPPAPWFRAMTIYKLWRSRSLPWSLTLFKDLQFSVTLELDAILSLRDPTQFISYLQTQGLDAIKQKDLQDLFPKLEETFLTNLKNEASGRIAYPRSAFQQKVLLPLAPSFLHAEDDLSWYIQGASETKLLGLDVRLILRKVSPSDAYNNLVQDCIVIAQKALIELKQALTIAAASHENEQTLSGERADYTEQGLLEQQESLQKFLYGERKEQIQSLRPPFYRLLDETTKQSIPQSTTLRIVLFNEVIYQIVEQVARHTITAQSPPLSDRSLSSAYKRTEYIRSFFLAAQTEGWTLFPDIAERVKEEISVNLDQENHLLLIIPSAYPHSKTKLAITNVKIQGKRISQEDVNKVLEPFMRRDDYTPMSIIQSVIDAVSVQNLKP
jgi:hypothetical protein